jgi:predicted transcriptional regulator
MSATRKPLGHGELESLVLDQLWASGELSTPSAYELVGKPRGLAYTTVLTILQRLLKKGLVVRKEEGKRHLYAPALSKDEFARRQGVQLAARVVALSGEGLAAMLAEAQRLDPAVIAALREKVEQAEA